MFRFFFFFLRISFEVIDYNNFLLFLNCFTNIYEEILYGDLKNIYRLYISFEVRYIFIFLDYF